MFLLGGYVRRYKIRGKVKLDTLFGLTVPWCGLGDCRSMERVRLALPQSRSSRLGLVMVSLLGVLALLGPILVDHPSPLHQTFLQAQHVRSYPVLHAPRSCRSTQLITLLLAIKSHPAHWERRAAVRNTWGRERAFGGRKFIRRVFLLGSGGGVAEESERHGDVLQWSFTESFFNVTLKEVLFWRWFRSECASSTLFILKGDDDVFVDVDRVLALLRPAQPDTPLYLGHIFVDTQPVRNWLSKYYVPRSMYTGPYPPYAGGGGYLLSREAVRLLLTASKEVPLFPIDDAFVGMCAARANVTAQHHDGFMPREYSPFLDPCAYGFPLVLHALEPKEQRSFWSFLESPRSRTCAQREGLGLGG